LAYWAVAWAAPGRVCCSPWRPVCRYPSWALPVPVGRPVPGRSVDSLVVPTKTGKLPTTSRIELGFLPRSPRLRSITFLQCKSSAVDQDNEHDHLKAPPVSYQICSLVGDSFTATTTTTRCLWTRTLQHAYRTGHTQYDKRGTQHQWVAVLSLLGQNCRGSMVNTWCVAVS
jgi:hypothetical protein